MLGKYLAAVAIYTVSLLFSLVCNYLVLSCSWASPGRGPLRWHLRRLLAGGRWRCWPIGMVASFLTGNLTVGFVLGVLFNVPLVLPLLARRRSSAVVGASARPLCDTAIEALEHQRSSSRFQPRRDQPVRAPPISSPILAVMLYLSMVLIGRRHWCSGGGRSSWSPTTSSARWPWLVAVAAVTVFVHGTTRAVDVTSEQLSSLSPQTVEVAARDLKLERPVQIEAFVSPSVPENYVQTRLNLLAHARRAPGPAAATRSRSQVHDTERFSERPRWPTAATASTPGEVDHVEPRGPRPDHIFLDVAVTCGLQKVIVPFIDQGMPVEYELVRSICTVSPAEARKRWAS